MTRSVLIAEKIVRRLHSDVFVSNLLVPMLAFASGFFICYYVHVGADKLSVRL